MKGLVDSKDMENKISLAENWFLNSGIQNISKDKDTYGSFNAWYDTTNKKFSFVYSEITGYGINTLLYLNKIDPSNLLIERAEIAADWLMNKAFDPDFGGILCRFDRNKNEFNGKICTFDNGVCLNAFMNLYKATSKDKYLDISIKIADWLLKMQKDDGSFYTRHIINDNFLEDNGDKWSKQSGTFHSKISLGLLNLGKLLKENKYITSARKICDWSLNLQTEEGRFITDRNDNSTFLHPFCYTNEGLICAGIVLNEDKYISSVKKGVQWVLKNKIKNNGFPAYFVDDKFIGIDSPDINAQVLRLILILENLKSYDDEKHLDTFFTNILAYQCSLKDKESNGGFYSGDAWFFGEEKNKSKSHVNSWVTMFIMQTLNMYVKYKNLDKETIFYLV